MYCEFHLTNVADGYKFNQQIMYIFMVIFYQHSSAPRTLENVVKNKILF